MKSILSSLKAEVDISNIDELKSLSNNLSNLKSKINQLDIIKLAPVAVDLSKLTDVVRNEVVKKTECNAKVKNVEDKIPDITNLAAKTIFNTKINEVKTEY